MNLKKGINNFVWLFSENFVSIFLGAITSVIVVRYLGPEKNGILNYCIAFVSLWSGFSDMGAANIIQREEVVGKVDTSTLIGTGLVLGSVGGIITAFGSAITMILLGESRVAIICAAIIGASYIIKAVYIIKYILMARLQAELFVKANIKTQIIMVIVKILLVLGKGEIYFFACCYLAEAFLQAFFYVRIGRKVFNRISCKVSFKVLRNILLQSWPNIIGNFAIIIYMKSDQIMIGRYLGEEAVGIYSVAVTISEFTQFIPMIILNIMLPILTEVFKTEKERFKQEYINYFEKTLLIMFFVLAGVMIFAKIMVSVLYGQAYMGAVSIVRIYVIAQIFCAITVAEDIYINLYRLQKKSMCSTCIAAVVNIFLNFVLIENYRCEGAAFATIIAMLCSATFPFWIWKDTREMISWIVYALRFKNTRREIKILLRKLERKSNI